MEKQTRKKEIMAVTILGSLSNLYGRGTHIVLHVEPIKEKKNE